MMRMHEGREIAAKKRHKLHSLTIAAHAFSTQSQYILPESSSSPIMPSLIVNQGFMECDEISLR